jgi:hypothetical protein
MTTVRIRSPKDLAPAIRKLGKAVDRELVKGMRKAARYGATEVVRTAQTTHPRPRASGTYIRSWTVIKTKDGADLANTSRHAPFVEEGRRPGKQPPREAIVEWVKLKKMASSRAKVRGIAIAVARKIGRTGTRGRFVLKRTMPKIDVEARRQTVLAIKRAIARQ